MTLESQLLFFITAFFNFAIACTVYLHRPDEKINKTFALFVGSISGWILTLFLLYSWRIQPFVIVFGRANFVFAELIAFFVFFFVYLFPRKLFSLPRLVTTGLFVWVTLLTTVTLATGLIDENEIVVGVATKTFYGPWYPIFVTHFAAFSLASIVLLVIKIRSFKGEMRQQLEIFAGGWLLGVIIGSLTNIALPNLGLHTSQYGPVSSIVLVAAIAYAVAKHEMLNVKIIAAEVFLLTLMLLLVINIALAYSPSGQLIAVMMLLFGGFAGFALVRDVRQEIRLREMSVSLSKELAAANDHLKRLDELKSEFVSIASHQLRTPVSIIKGYLALLRDGMYGEIPEPVRAKIVQIAEMNERQVRLINNLLNVSRIERSRIEYNCLRFDVIRIIIETSEEMLAEVTRHGLTMEFPGAATTP
ncbi:MAG: histidine kinase dimerization/phospho-acceptor domain-containing protein, partial [Patescibacteria group bacterium]|nr:histidine kinase dimerization/phospho-acceptor domain-containing protein [Patescibacteria group bacterium]